MSVLYCLSFWPEIYFATWVNFTHLIRKVTWKIGYIVRSVRFPVSIAFKKNTGDLMVAYPYELLSHDKEFHQKFQGVE